MSSNRIANCESARSPRGCTSAASWNRISVSVISAVSRTSVGSACGYCTNAPTNTRELKTIAAVT